MNPPLKALRRALILCAGTVVLSHSSSAHAGVFQIDHHTFTLPDGFVIEKVAGPPLVDRPIVADLDEQGRLYVADSSGSNDKVQRQLEDKPHRILRLLKPRQPIHFRAPLSLGQNTPAGGVHG